MAEEEHKTIIDEIKTGFEAITDKGLVNFNSSDVRDGDRIVAESNRRLKNEIKRFNETSSKQTSWIIGLTIAMFSLGIIQIGLLILQIFQGRV